MSRRVRRPALWLVVPALAVVQFLVWVAAGASPAQAATDPSSVDLTVRSARTVSAASTSVKEGQPVTAYRWLITVDDKGNPADDVTKCTPTDGHGSYAPPTSAGVYAIGDGGANGYDYTGITTDSSTCQWPSVRYTPGAVGVVDEGAVGIDETDPVTGAPIAQRSPAQAQLKPGKYLISVTADGYKIDGQHFTVDGSGNPVPVLVTMQPYPLPLGTLGVQVFKDTVPVDGTYEAGTEDPLAGFTLHINDVLGEVTTDFYGNRLCTNYVKDAAGHVVLDADNMPTIDAANPGGTCLSGADGVIRVPNMGTDRYTVTIVPPAGQKWFQTTTLEGNHDWDYWVQEGEQGYDTEVTVGGENVPPVAMGFVPWNYAQGANDSTPAGLDAKGFTGAGTGEVKGQVVIDNTYIGGTGGITAPTELSLAGMNERGPVANPIVALSDLGNNDQLAWVGRGDAQGNFDVRNVPAGTYQATFWDYNQDLIINSVNVTVADGQVVDMGHQGLVGWYTQITGKVCIDDNGNGRCDTGENGVPKFLLTLKERDNSLWDQGQNATTTDDQGNYTFSEAYPAVRWSVLEAFNTRYKTTGVTVQADNEPTPTYYTGAGVDISVLPVIGLSGRVDWAVQPYTNGENGGIVGTVTYDTTRNELDPKYAFTEDYQPGIPGLKVHLYYPQRDANGDLVHEADGSVAVVEGPDGKPLDLTQPYTTETWQQPTGCTARQYDGTPLRSGVDQLALPPEGQDQYMCVEAPMTGWQVLPSDKTPGAFGQTVNGNYGFGAMDYDANSLADAATLQGTGTDAAAQPAKSSDPSGSEALPNDDYVVTVESPKLPDGQPLYQVTREQDVNVFDGDQRAPQENYPLADWTNAGADTVGTGIGAGGPVSNQPGIWMDCAGKDQTVHVTNPNFVANGGSPFEGQKRPLCDAKLVTLRGNQSVAPNFNLFTQVPLPTHYYGVVLNDLGLSHDKTQTLYGEAQPIPNVPVGLYDWAGRLVDTVTTDYNGMYETTVPSTSSFNCPLPAGPCPNVYYFKGNDPGLPGAPNPNYNPRFRTIGTSFQAWPGLFTVTDTAPQQAAAGVTLAPGSDVVQPVECAVNTGAPAGQEYPELFTTENPLQTAAQVAVPGDVAAQTLPVSSISVSGTGFTRTATLTVTGLVPTGVPPTVTLPTLNATNAPGVTGLAGTLLRAALSGQHQVTGVTATTISFTVLAGTNGTLTPVGVSASVPAYHWNAPQTIAAKATAVQTQGFGTTRTATFTLSPAVPRPAGGSLLSASVPTLTGVTTNPSLGPVLRNGIGTVTTWSAGGTPIGSLSGQFTLTLANRNTPNQSVTIPAKLPVSLSWSGYASAYVGGSTAQPQPLVLHGLHFGTTAGKVTATAVDGTTTTASVSAWSDTQIISTIALAPGAYRVSVTGSNGRTTVNGIGLHVLGSGYQPVVVQVNPPTAAVAALSTAAKAGVPGVPAGTRMSFGTNGVAAQVDTTYSNGTVAKPEDVVQKAVDAASAYAPTDSTTPAPLVVVWPKSSQVATNPHGEYFENLVVGRPVKLQGVGTGGFQGSNYVRGTTLDGLGFNADNAQGTQWLDAVTRYVGADNAVNVADGAVVTYLGNAAYDNAASATNRASIDGFTITGGDQGGAAPNNLNAVTGAAVTPAGGAGITTQGGGLFLDGHVNNLQVSDNAVTGNSGSYAGAIRVGTPYSAQTAAVAGSTELDPNTGLTVAYNRITDNGGTNLAGGIGLFDGSTGYSIDHNDLCGNFSAEYGGGISHYGRSDGGSITFNRIYLNQSYDEGGGVMVAGELNLDQTQVSPGAARQITATSSTGPATTLRIDGNVVERNVANDDGGGLRFLSAGNTPIDVTNNSVVDNISTHEGGGIALDDSTMVRIVGDTVMKNITTATAVTSNGDPAPAGISTAGNSEQLQATLPSGSASYSKPFVRNVVLLDNRAGSFAPSLGTTVGSVSGSLGTAAATVDKDTTFLVEQTAAGSGTIPAPTVNVRTGRRIVVANTGTATLTLQGAAIAAGGRQAYSWNGSAWVTSTVGPLPVDVTGIGQLDDPTAVAVWDLGSTDVGVSGMDAGYSVLSAPVTAGTATQAPVTVTSTGATLTATGDVAVPATAAATLVKNAKDVSVTILNSRTFPAFRQAVIVTTAVSPTWDSDYHLVTGGTAPNPAANAGAPTLVPPTGPAPVTDVGHDIDNATRTGTYDIGSDEAF